MAQRVLLLSQWFEPEPTFKGMLFARELRRRGYEVEAVTGFPNYPGGRIYPGYRLGWRRKETIEGISVARLFLYPSHDSSPVKRIATYASFAFSALIYCLFSAEKPDVIYVYQLPTAAFAAVIAGKIRGVPVVFDIQDIWPDTLRATGMVGNENVLRWVGRALQWIYSRATAIVVLSPGFRRVLITRGVPESKLSVIYNWCDADALSNPGATELEGMPGPEFFRIVFAGNMGKAQSLDSILEAAAQLESSHPRIRFVLIGGGVELPRLRAAAEREGRTNVVFVPRLPMNRVGAYLRAADAVLVHLKDDPLFSITIPGKTQAYMALGKPILMAVAGDAADLVREAGCGVAASPGEPASIAAAAISLAELSADELRRMGDRGADYYRERLSVRVGVDKFATVFRRAIEMNVKQRPVAERPS